MAIISDNLGIYKEDIHFSTKVLEIKKRISDEELVETQIENIKVFKKKQKIR